MLLLDRKPYSSVAFVFMLSFVFVTALGGCSVRPLYSTQADGRSVASALQNIEIQSATDRVGQRIRNELIFNFQNGQSPTNPLYNLTMTTIVNELSVAIQRDTGTPAARTLNLNVRYILRERETNTVLLKETAFANASYNYSDQRFANLRAKRDAENRTAKDVAENINLRLATFFATRPSNAQ